MKSFSEMYSVHDDEWGFCVSDYSPLIESIAEVVAREDDDGYQGDTFVIFRDANNKSRFGFLSIGWGSCSGCDALQSCSSPLEVEELRDGLARGVKWGTAQEIADHMRGAEERCEYYVGEWCGGAFGRLREKVIDGSVFAKSDEVAT
jgi:hypothetical protein